ncbi:MAG: BlaI/MecI/CopY family transcriptional regulator [Eubacterium sp.]|nr:BlaI/MecI/CopY family transcriptional regulator [Lachnospiraceae bacterium]MBO5487742.1 BlaI/MecI/CopY family transcriptional regulator [Eubacterium sp.]
MDRKVTVSDAELEILEVLWSSDKALNAGEIRNLLNASKNWERTTVLTLIQRLLKKGVISQEKREVYYYLPCIRREEYVKEETKNFVDKFFRGSSRNLAAALVNSEALTKEDIEELRDYFNRNCR